MFEDLSWSDATMKMRGNYDTQERSLAACLAKTVWQFGGLARLANSDIV